MKRFTVTRIVNEFKFGTGWGKTEAKKFPETIFLKIFDTNSSLHVK